MATLPQNIGGQSQMQPAPTSTEGMDSAPVQEEGGEPSGYTICIRVAADGSISTGVERETAEEAAEEYADFRPAANIKEALTDALELFRADGQRADTAADDAEFAAGFGSPKELA